MTQDKSQNSEKSGDEIADKLQIHPVFCFNDGSIILQAQKQLFRVHHSFLSRLSPFFAALKTAETPNDIVALGNGILAHDLEVLLEHLYHDIPLSADSSIDRFASILRISQSRSLDFPTVHATAKTIFTSKFPHGPVPNYRPANILEALAVSTEYHIGSVRKVLLYSIVTSNEFDFHDAIITPPQPVQPSELETTISPSQGMSEADKNSCSNLMIKLIDYFTPLLFTPATTPHIPCTDVFASTWMPLIVQPAIENEGLAKPLETLEQMKSINWEAQGLCLSCILEKQGEWTAEQQTIWKQMDNWLKL